LSDSVTGPLKDPLVAGSSELVTLPGKKGKTRPRAPAGPRCVVCRDLRLWEISTMLARGESQRATARRFGFTPETMRLHCLTHMGPELRSYALCEPVLIQIKKLTARTLKILEDAERAHDPELALRAIAQARANLELTAKLSGELRRDNPGEDITVEVRYVDAQPR
jgi:hypothetical protein